MSKKIIVIEDDPLLLKALHIELLSNDFKGFSAKDGKQGLMLVIKEKLDLILLDLVIPGGLGFEVFESLKRHKNTKTQRTSQ